MSDNPGLKRTATKHPNVKILLMTCTCEIKQTIHKIMNELVSKKTLGCVSEEVKTERFSHDN